MSRSLSAEFAVTLPFAEHLARLSATGTPMNDLPDLPEYQDAESETRRDHLFAQVTLCRAARRATDDVGARAPVQFLDVTDGPGVAEASAILCAQVLVTYSVFHDQGPQAISATSGRQVNMLQILLEMLDGDAALSASAGLAHLTGIYARALDAAAPAAAVTRLAAMVRDAAADADRETPQRDRRRTAGWN